MNGNKANGKQKELKIKTTAAEVDRRFFVSEIESETEPCNVSQKVYRKEKGQKESKESQKEKGYVVSPKERVKEICET